MAETPHQIARSLRKKTLRRPIGSHSFPGPILYPITSLVYDYHLSYIKLLCLGNGSTVLTYAVGLTRHCA